MFKTGDSPLESQNGLFSTTSKLGRCDKREKAEVKRGSPGWSSWAVISPNQRVSSLRGSSTLREEP